ncbi:aminotransferase class IV [Adhaeribacter radiodurans]|uniref:branched-chain-amino-acid transaminase n=1 Tax=Adhaeribacter radiodurans TaxID=2745197 RepID=A0A7L7L747_9BACT|nr:aminotransferase class IV [Adhaeribacter radiodurans]QMU28630.1 aminotransferase class IV [Adhaeribacter radiodurans]
MLQQYDSRNADIKVWVNGLCSRQDARVSVFDSVVQGGDAVWEGIRIYNGFAFMLEQHIDRLQESAHALAFAQIPSREEIKEAVITTLQANNMHDGAHIRLTLTRGEKITSGMDPRLNQAGCTLIVLAEHKPPVYDNSVGIRLVSSAIRRNNPQFLDSKIHHNNLLNNILAKIEANLAGADDALMLDILGFVAETNATNLFMVKKNILYTPLPDACLPGITRKLVLEMATDLDIPAIEKNLSLTEFYNADEVFATGTMGELTPVQEIDGRTILNRHGSDILSKLQQHFTTKIEVYGVKLPF